MSSFEQNLQGALFSKQAEKTFIDKLLAKEDSHRVKELISKKDLKREELLELLYLLSGTETKLVNYGEWDRYVVLKYFVWIRQFVKICESLFDYQDDLKESITDQKKRSINLTPRAKQLLKNIERNLEHATKFNIDLYFNIIRSTLSLGGTGFIEMLKNKFEISYPQGQPHHTPDQPQQKGGLFRRS